MSNVAFDAATFNAGNLPSFSHTCSGSNRYLFTCVHDWSVNPLNGYATGCTYNGVAMTDLGSKITTPDGYRLFGLVNPASGSHTVTVTTGSGAGPIAWAISFTNVHQTVPIGTPGQASGIGTTATISVTGTNVESLVVAFLTYFGGNGSFTAGVGQTVPTGSPATSGNTGAALAYKGGGGTVTLTESWASGTNDWAKIAVELFTATPTVTSSHGLTTLGVGN